MYDCIYICTYASMFACTCILLYIYVHMHWSTQY